MNEFAEARDTMREIFEADLEPGSIYHGYVSNIAMYLHDRCGITGFQPRNDHAKELMKLIFDVDKAE